MHVTVSISPDRLKAVIECPEGVKLDVPQLRQLLAAHGIATGLVRETVEALSTPHGDPRAMVLARGVPPTKGFPGALEPALIEEGLPRPISSGDVIGRYTPPKLGRPGVGVDGKPIPATWQSPPLSAGRGLKINGDQTLIATRDGMLMKDKDGSLIVAIPNLEETEKKQLAIRVSIDQLEASVTLKPGEYATEVGIRESLAHARITHGVLEDELANLKSSDENERTIVIARGTASRPGADAQVEYLQLGDPNKANIGDKVDFRSESHINDIETGTKIVRVIPPTEGQPGKSVKGQEIKPAKGKGVDLGKLAGIGTRVDPNDPLVIVATADGVCARTAKGVVEVSAQLNINGDVDYRTGSLDSKYAIHIKGDVKAGFSVTSGADITIGGLVEDARISAKGSLTVKGGILPGKNRVKANGHLSARFIDNREVKAKVFNVSGCIGNCQVLATDQVVAKEIIGGKTICTRSVQCERLGHDNGAHTDIQIGINAEAHAVYSATLKERQHLIGVAAANKQRVELISHRIKISPTDQPANPDDDKELRQAVAERDDVMHRLEKCESVLAHHEHQLAEQTGLKERANVTVRLTAFPGVRIVFGDDLTLTIQEQMVRPFFRLKENQIVW
jgi:uncharacterized protein (DUF342 family)